MRAPIKVALVAAGYIGAFLVASGAVAIRVARTSGPDRQAAQGMYGLGDDVLFLAVFGLASTVATAAALFFLRPYPRFWTVFSSVSFVIATTAVAVLVIVPSLAPLRFFLAPVFGAIFVLGTVFAPSRSFRLRMGAATFMELGAFVWTAQMLAKSM